MIIKRLLICLAVLTLSGSNSWAEGPEGFFCDGFENCEAGSGGPGYLVFRHSQTELGPFGVDNCDSNLQTSTRRLAYVGGAAGPCIFHGGVSLPHGMFLQEMRCWFDDFDADRQVNVQLLRYDLNSLDPDFVIFSLASPSDGSLATATDTTATEPQVDNSNFMYSVKVTFSGDNVFNLAFRGCAIKYGPQEN